MRIRPHALLGILLLGALAAGSAGADEPRGAGPDFQRDVVPIFEARCLHCHGAKRRDGKLDMRSVDSLLAGGVSGPAIKPGNAQKSLLIELLHYNEMPPKKERSRVTKAELELLRKWINQLPPAAASKRTAFNAPRAGFPLPRAGQEIGSQPSHLNSAQPACL